MPILHISTSHDHSFTHLCIYRNRHKQEGKKIEAKLYSLTSIELRSWNKHRKKCILHCYHQNPVTKNRVLKAIKSTMPRGSLKSTNISSIILPVFKPFRSIKFFHISGWRKKRSYNIIGMTFQVLTYTGDNLTWNGEATFSNPSPINTTKPWMSFDGVSTLASKSRAFVNIK